MISAAARHNPDMPRSRLAMDAIPLIRARLAELEERGGHEPISTGRLAALWRVQARAARLELTVDDLRRYCLQWLGRRRMLDAEDESDYLRGYREGFQAVLRDIRKLEARRRGA